MGSESLSGEVSSPTTSQNEGTSASSPAEQERILARAILRPFSLVGLCVYTALSVMHVALLEADVRLTMTAGAAVTAVICGFLWARWRTQTPALEHVFKWTALILFLGYANSLAHVWMTQDIKHATNIALVLIATGYLLTDLRWFLPAAIGELLVTIAVMVPIASNTQQDVAHYSIMLFLAMALALVLRRSRALHAELTWNVGTLRMLIPLCAACGKARDDDGYWTRVDAYIHDHLKHDVTHGICPDCAKEFYGDYAK